MMPSSTVRNNGRTRAVSTRVWPRGRPVERATSVIRDRERAVFLEPDVAEAQAVREGQLEVLQVEERRELVAGPDFDIGQGAGDLTRDPRLVDLGALGRRSGTLLAAPGGRVARQCGIVVVNAD